MLAIQEHRTPSILFLIPKKILHLKFPSNLFSSPVISPFPYSFKHLDGALMVQTNIYNSRALVSGVITLQLLILWSTDESAGLIKFLPVLFFLIISPGGLLNCLLPATAALLFQR